MLPVGFRGCRDRTADRQQVSAGATAAQAGSMVGVVPPALNYVTAGSAVVRLAAPVEEVMAPGVLLAPQSALHLDPIPRRSGHQGRSRRLETMPSILRSAHAERSRLGSANVSVWRTYGFWMHCIKRSSLARRVASRSARRSLPCCARMSNTHTHRSLSFLLRSAEKLDCRRDCTP